MRIRIIQEIIDLIRKKKRPSLIEKLEDLKILKDKSLDIEIPNDLLLHLGFNANCNCRCKFCSQGDQRYIEKELIDQDLLYKDLLPLYPKTKYLIPTQGEITCVPEAYEYLKWIHENYPHINISIESNAIAFNEKWQELAIDNLMNVHFSVNAIDDKSFLRTVWGDEGGEKIFSQKIYKNIENYINKLKQNDLECFTPSVSSVLNSSNYHETVDFIKMALKWGCTRISFYFDTKENNLKTKHIKNKEGFIQSLRSICEIERVLKGKASFYYSLFMPYDDLGKMQNEVINADVNMLNKKYEDIVRLAEDLNCEELTEKRNKKRKEKGKKEFDEFGRITWQNHYENGVMVCSHPWNTLRIRANGYMNVCSWRGYKSNFKIQDFKKEGKINWNDVFNSAYYKKLRKAFKDGCYQGCMNNCPAIPQKKEQRACKTI